MLTLHITSSSQTDTDTLTFISPTTPDYITNKEDVDIRWQAYTEFHKPARKRINTSAGLSS